MNEDFQSSVLVSVSKCPSCGGELEKGYAFTEQIAFDTQKKRFFRLSRKYILTKNPTWGLTLPALRCDNCNIVIIDYSWI